MENLSNNFAVVNDDEGFSGYPTIHAVSPLGRVVFVLVDENDDGHPVVQLFAVDDDGPIGEYTNYAVVNGDFLKALRTAVFDVFSKETPSDLQLAQLLREARS